jgi:hypothetical protein
MKGTLKYYEPDSEVNYPGGWAVIDNGGIINRRSYQLSKKSLNWIKYNDTLKVMEVEFEVVPDCYFSEDENKGYHRFVAEINFNNDTSNYLDGFINQFGGGPLGELDPEEWGALEFLRWLKVNNYKITKENDNK